MRKTVYRLALAGCLTLILAPLAWPHGGGLDRCGGHNDRKRGGYHVHNWSSYCACNPGASDCAGKSAGAAPAPASAKPTGQAQGDTLAGLRERVAKLEERVAVLESAIGH